MKITRANLNDAAKDNVISAEQADALFNYLKAHLEESPQFSITHVLYYMGGIIAIGAMTLFMNLGWERFGGAGIFFISLLYAGIGLLITNNFAKRNLIIPAGICATFVTCVTPLAIFGLQQWAGFWPDESAYRDFHRLIQWHWIYMELGTLIVGCIVAWKYKYPFLIMPIAVTLWYMTMDITSMISGENYNWTLRSLVSIYTGLLMVCLAFWVDIRSRHTLDYAFWLYIFGVIAFWGGLSSQSSDSELSKFIYLLINLVMIAVGVVLVRRIFVILGAIGGCGYLAHLASNVFADSWLFPVALTVIGLGVVYLGVLWQKNEAVVTTKCHQLLPQALREMLQKHSIN